MESILTQKRSIKNRDCFVVGLLAMTGEDKKTAVCTAAVTLRVDRFDSHELSRFRSVGIFRSRVDWDGDLLVCILRIPRDDENIVALADEREHDIEHLIVRGDATRRPERILGTQAVDHDRSTHRGSLRRHLSCLDLGEQTIAQGSVDHLIIERALNVVGVGVAYGESAVEHRLTDVTLACDVVPPFRRGLPVVFELWSPRLLSHRDGKARTMTVDLSKLPVVIEPHAEHRLEDNDQRFLLGPCVIRVRCRDGRRTCRRRQ